MGRYQWGLGLSFLTAVGLTAMGDGVARADGAWLDSPLTNWNVPGQSVPKASPMPNELDPRCVERARTGVA